MVRKVIKKKSGIRIFVMFLIIIAIAAFSYRTIITPENNQRCSVIPRHLLINTLPG